MVKVRFFAIIKNLAGKEDAQFDVGGSIKLKDLIGMIEKKGKDAQPQSATDGAWKSRPPLQHRQKSVGRDGRPRFHCTNHRLVTFSSSLYEKSENVAERLTCPATALSLPQI